MKKVLWVVGILILLFIGLTYWSLSSTSKTFRTCEIIGMENLDTINFKDYDSVTIAASTLYQGNEIKQIMQGSQYRKAWSTPVKVPILYLDTLKGSVEILEEGGGHQTHSLKLETQNGTLMTLRSVTKDPSPVIPKVAEQLGLENIVVDGISAQHPYAALVVSRLSKDAKIYSTKPQLVFLPKQDQLQDFNEKFGNRLFLLEYETDGNASWLGQKNVNRLVDTEDLQELKLERPNQKITIDEHQLIRARLFDLLIGDWDRHAKQWGWALEERGDSITAIPLPCDRDNAFFNLEGVLPTLISNKAFLPEVQSFENEIDYLEGLISPFDIYFMKGIPEEVFIQESHYLQNALSDEVIKSAFEVWPQDIYALDAEELIEKMKSRRNQLDTYAIQFKKILNESEPLEVALKGSEDLKMSKEQMQCFSCL